MHGGVIIPNKDTARALNDLARHKAIVRILNDIRMNMEICEIEGWDKNEYLNQLRQLLNSIGGKTMDDLISRAEALEAMDTLDKFGCDPDGKLVRYDDDKHYVPYVHYEDMVHVIKALSSAQPEIIRCKYCRHGVDYYKEGDCYCTNPKWGLKYFGGSWEFYCADAERKAPGTRV